MSELTRTRTRLHLHPYHNEGNYQDGFEAGIRWAHIHYDYIIGVLITLDINERDSEKGGLNE